MSAYWEAAASKAEKPIGQTVALDCKHHTHPTTTQSSALTLETFNYLSKPSDKARESRSDIPFHELSVCYASHILTLEWAI